MSRRLTTSEFIKRAKSVHGDRYDYSLVEYKNISSKVKIICEIHGVFEQAPGHHMNGHGCKLCSNNTKLTTSRFIEKAKQIHKDKYDYSLVDYKTSHIKVKLICQEHGLFEQTPNSHLNGNGCSKCSKKYNYTTEEFIKRAKSVHGDRYDYSLVEYKNISSKVKIICEIHGVFEQIPPTHINKQCGCPKCSKLEAAQKIRYTQTQVLTKALSIHKDKYDYSLVKYKSSIEKVKIICHKHGVFEQRLADHINQSNGCPRCVHTISKPEIELQEYIKSIYPHLVITNSRAIIHPYELDIYLPDINLAIEFNGDYWHSSEDAKRRDKETKKLCKERGIRLMIVWERYWIRQNEKTKKAIEQSINKSNLQRIVYSNG